jgi:hypothetical protein
VRLDCWNRVGIPASAVINVITAIDQTFGLFSWRYRLLSPTGLAPLAQDAAHCVTLLIDIYALLIPASVAIFRPALPASIATTAGWAYGVHDEIFLQDS